MTNFYDNGVFKRPNEVTKGHLRQFHIKTMVEGRMVNRVLVDRGVGINLLPKSMLRKLGKTANKLVKANIAVTNLNCMGLAAKGVVMLNVSVSSVDRAQCVW